MVVDKGKDWPGHIEGQLNAYGEEMWLYRDQPDALTTRALNIYKGEYRGCVAHLTSLLLSPL